MFEAYKRDFMMELGEASTVNVASASVFNTTQQKNPKSKQKGEVI